MGVAITKLGEGRRGVGRAGHRAVASISLLLVPCIAHVVVVAIGEPVVEPVVALGGVVAIVEPIDVGSRRPRRGSRSREWEWRSVEFQGNELAGVSAGEVAGGHADGDDADVAVEGLGWVRGELMSAEDGEWGEEVAGGEDGEGVLKVGGGAEEGAHVHGGLDADDDGAELVVARMDLPEGAAKGALADAHQPLVEAPDEPARSELKSTLS